MLSRSSDLEAMGTVDKGRYRARGARIRQAMEDAGIKQKDLGKILGIRQSAVSEFVTGKTPGQKHLQKLAKILGVSPTWITRGYDEKPMDERTEELLAALRLELMAKERQLQWQQAEMSRLRAELTRHEEEQARHRPSSAFGRGAPKRP